MEALETGVRYATARTEAHKDIVFDGTEQRNDPAVEPNRDPAKPCVYVGMTGLAVQDRFQNHKEGQKSAWIVKKYGLRLMPELYEFLNPMPFEAAAEMEKDLAEDLRAEGYTVAGGT
jgi:hypothetical protein